MDDKNQKICMRLSWDFRMRQLFDCRQCPYAPADPKPMTHALLVDLWYLFYPTNKRHNGKKR